MTIEIELTQGYKALVSDRHAEKIAGINFWAEKKKDGRVYARGRISGKQKYLHVFLMQPPPGMLVDHVDGNGLNCVDENMRICNDAENAMNRKISGNNSIGYKGVVVRDRKRPFRAKIVFNSKVINIGCFNDPEAAARAYDAKARELFGEFARLNFPDEA